MKNYAKVGNRKGNPAYRTPSMFRGRVHLAMRHNMHAYNPVIKKIAQKRKLWQDRKGTLID